jgi:hypothetical protein
MAPTAPGQQPDATRMGDAAGTQVAAGPTQMGAAPAAATQMGTGPEADTASLPAGGSTPPRGTAVPAAERRVSPALIAGIAVAVLALAVVGFLVGKGGGGDSQPEGTSTARSGAITITYPSTWQQSDQVPAPPGYQFTNPIAVGPKGQPNNRLVTGLVDASGPTLLPAAFVKSLGADPNRNDTVRLGDLQAYRYRNLDPSNFNPSLTLYAVPTDKGIATIACQADPAQAAKFLPECERAASTLKLDGAKPFDLGPGRDYVDRVNGTLDKLQSARADQISALKSASTPAAQGKAASNISRAYDSAAKALSRAPVSPQVKSINDEIVGALNDASDAWGKVADGANAADAGDYKAGERAVKKAEQQLATALDGLNKQS